MSAHQSADAHSTPEEIRKHIKLYVMIGFALLLGTILTVAMYFVHFADMWVTVTIALIIASVKASLVAGFFMHLLSERKLIYTTLTVTGFFFAGLMALTLWAMQDSPDNAIHRSHPHVAPAAVTAKPAPAPAH